LQWQGLGMTGGSWPVAGISRKPARVWKISRPVGLAGWPRYSPLEQPVGDDGAADLALDLALVRASTPAGDGRQTRPYLVGVG
jgi:hypothetical protein